MALLWVSMRNIQLVNLSLPKTGTKSIAGLFSAFRARHEYQLDAATKILEAHYEGRANRRDLSAFLLTRDALGQLEVDSSSVNFWFAEEFVTLMPQAKFLLVLREPFKWLDSVLNHLQRDVLQMQARELPFPAGFLRLAKISGVSFDPTSAEDPENFRNAVPGLSRQLLQFWIDQNDRILKIVPHDRRLILETEELSRSHRVLSSFADIDTEMLTPASGHEHKRPNTSNLYHTTSGVRPLEPVELQASHLWAKIQGLGVTDQDGAKENKVH